MFVDIGANIGLFSLVAAANPNCAEVAAFEPVPDTFCYLVENCALNQADNVSPFCGAVTNDPSKLIDLSFTPGHSGSAHISQPHESNGAIRSLTIGLETLDALLMPLKASRVVVKVDVEGAEVGVIEVLSAAQFCGAISDVFIEVSRKKIGHEGVVELYRLLNSIGLHEVARHDVDSHYDAHFQK